MPKARTGETKRNTTSPGKAGSSREKRSVRKTIIPPVVPAGQGDAADTDSGGPRPAHDVVMLRLIKKQAFLKKLGDKRKRYYLSDDVTTIGSSKSSLLTVHDPAVAVLHARIEYKKGEYILYEHEMTGHTYVNGVEVTECSLRDGDILRFGSTSYGFFHRSSSWYGGF